MADIDGLYKRADEAFQKRNYGYSIELFMQILMFSPDHAQSRKALRATVIKKFQEGGGTSRFALMAYKGKTEMSLKTTKDPAKRIEICQKHLLDDPTNNKIRTYLAEGLLTLGHTSGAAAEAEMAMEGESNVPAAKVLVQALTHLDKVQEAQAILQRFAGTLKEDRDLERLQRDLAARQTMKKGFEDSAGKEGFRKVLKNSDQATDLERKQHLIRSDAEIQAEIDELQVEMQANPTDFKVPKKIADLYFERKKDYSQAREWYKKASQLAPQDSVLRDKMDDCNIRMYEVQVEAAKKAGDDAKVKEHILSKLKFVIQSFERRVQDRPTDMGLRFELGTAYLQVSLTDKAIAEFQQSIKDPKRKSVSHLLLGKAFQKKKLFDMADKQYEAAESGVLEQARKLDILYNRSVCNAEAGKKEKAIELGKSIMEIDISYKDIAQLVEKWQQ